MDSPGGATARDVRWWGLGSASAAPVLLTGGWTLAATLQPGHFDSTRDTISDLAAVGMPHRWVMSAALAGLGLCHLLTAAALRPAAWRGRAVLAIGGLATVSVAANPLPSQGGYSALHTGLATASFLALAVWPAMAGSKTVDAGRRSVLARPVRYFATAVLVATVLWLFTALRSGSYVGLAERVAAGAQALWPLAVVLGLRR